MESALLAAAAMPGASFTTGTNPRMRIPAPRMVIGVTPRSSWMPHEGAKQNAKAQFGLDELGQKIPHRRWSNKHECVVQRVSSGNDVEVRT